MVDYMRDVKPLVDAKQSARIQAADFQRGAREQVALSMQQVTQSEPWNVYLQHLTAMLDLDEKAATDLSLRLERPEVADPNEVNGIRLKLQRLRGRIEARKRDMELPKSLIAAAEKVA
jgi:hypothetical protein